MICKWPHHCSCLCKDEAITVAVIISVIVTTITVVDATVIKTVMFNI